MKISPDSQWLWVAWAYNLDESSKLINLDAPPPFSARTLGRFAHAAFSHDGKRIFVCGHEVNPGFGELTTPIRTSSLDAELMPFGFSFVGHKLAAVTLGNAVRIFDADGTPLHTFPKREGFSTSISTSQKKIAITYSMPMEQEQKCHTLVYNIDDLSQAVPIEGEVVGQFSPDGRYVMVRRYVHGRLVKYMTDLQEKEETLLPSPGSVDPGSGDPAGLLRDFFPNDVRLRRWLLQAVIPGDVNPDGTLVVHWTPPETFATVSNLSSGEDIGILAGNAALSDALFSPDGCRIVVAAKDGKLKTWIAARPHQWWGLAWLPAFWSTVVFASAFIWSVCARK